MFKRFKYVLDRKSSFLNDFFSLILLQGFNYLLAFLITPYVVRQLGPENYGLVSFSQAYVTYFTLIINFGFDFTATRDIANNGNNGEAINKIFNEVLMAKLILFIASCAIFFITLLLSNELRDDSTLHIASFLINIGFVLYPQWLFQGLSKMRVALLITLAVRVLMLALIIGFVKTKEDYGIYNLVNSISNILLGTIAIVYLTNSKVIRIQITSVRKLIEKLRSSFNVFLSLAVYSLYTSSNIVLLGFLSTKESTGFFTCAVKLITITLGVLFTPFATIVFPKVSQKFSISFAEGTLFLKKVTWLCFLLGFFMSVIIFFFADQLIYLLFGDEFSAAASSLKHLSLLPLMTMLSNVFAIQGLLNLKMDKKFLVIMFTVGTSSILLNFLLIPELNEVGACISWNIAELIYVLMSCIYLSRRIGLPFDLNVARSVLNFKVIFYGK